MTGRSPILTRESRHEVQLLSAERSGLLLRSGLRAGIEGAVSMNYTKYIWVPVVNGVESWPRQSFNTFETADACGKESGEEYVIYREECTRTAVKTALTLPAKKV